MQGLTYPDALREDEATRVNTGAGYRLQLRAGAGYNSIRHYVGISFNQEQVGHLLDDRQRFTWSVTNIRFNVVRRFNMKVGFMDRGIKWLKKKGPPVMDDVLPQDT